MKYISYREELLNVCQLKEVIKKEEHVLVLYGDEKNGYRHFSVHDPKDLVWEDLKLFLSKGKGIFDMLQYEIDSVCDYIYRKNEPKKERNPSFEITDEEAEKTFEQFMPK